MRGAEAERPLRTVAWRVLTFQTVEVDDRPIALSRRSRAVLLRLLMSPNRSVSIDSIMDFVWGEDLPKTAANSVARFIADLRKALGPRRDRIVTADGGYRVVVHPGELDIERAEAILADAERLATADPGRCQANLLTGLQLVGSEPNVALTDAPNAAAILRSHEELRLAMLGLHLDVELRLGNAASLVATLEEVVARYPYNETFWHKLMRALDESGRAADALRAGQRARQALGEAGLDPSVDLTNLESTIAASSGGSEAASPSLTRLPARSTRIQGVAHGIAEPTTKMVGRLRELTELEAALATEPAISIIGIGGAGKTRIAIAMAKAIEATGRPVVRVALGPVPEADMVLPTVAAALGAPAGTAETPAALASAIAADSLVLLLDNCEHVVGAAAELVAAIYALAPQVQVIATSRHALGFDGEYVYQLGMLHVPEAGDPDRTAPALALLVDRAAPHLDAAQPNGEMLEQLSDITRLVSGHPMAIEVAASQLAYTSIDELVGRLGGRLRAAADNHDLPDPLTDVMDWAWNDLNGNAQMVLARTSVFGDTWTIGAAEALCPNQAGLDGIVENLVARGLVTTTVVAGQERYGMLEPARRYGLERLEERAEADVMRQRLTAWAKDLTERWAPAEQHVLAESSSALFAEHGNLIAALDHLDQGGDLIGLAELAINASGMWINHGLADEANRWLAPVIENEAVPDRIRSGAAAMVLAASHAAGELDELNPLGLRALELADGEAYDWIPAVASFLSLWALFSPGEQSSEELDELARSTAERSTSRDLNLAIADLYRAHVLFCTRDYGGAAALFASVRESVGRPGRLSHVSEVGQGLALLLGGRDEDARNQLDTWVSQHNTDDWHYMVDVARAVIRGGTGAANEATRELAAAVRGFPPARVWGRADEIQIAFGMLAMFRGEHDLGDQLLASVETRDVLLTVTAIELVARHRGCDDDLGWLGIAQDFWERVLPAGTAGRGSASTSPQLLSWWIKGPSEQGSAPVA